MPPRGGAQLPGRGATEAGEPPRRRHEEPVQAALQPLPLRDALALGFVRALS